MNLKNLALNNNQNTKFTHLDLFSGIGGFSLAASWMGWETVVQVEWDKYCQKVLAKNFPDTLRFGDIKEFNNGIKSFFTNSECLGWKAGSGERIQSQEQESEGSDFRNLCEKIGIGGRIDIITGGFPCQPFSHAGKRKGIDDSRYLWPEMLTTIRILKPSFVIGENVAGLVSMENGKTLDNILSDLANEGYQTEQFIIPACSVGAWHRRDRIWIVAYSINGTDRTNRGQSGKAERVSEINRSSGLSGEFSGTSAEILPHAHKFNNDNSRSGTSEISQQKEAKIFRNITSNCNNQGLQGGPEAGNINSIRTKRNKQSERYCELSGGKYWNSEPSVGRVANGISNRVDRLKGLGNSIVPQVVFEIFKAIEQIN